MAVDSEVKRKSFLSACEVSKGETAIKFFEETPNFRISLSSASTDFPATRQSPDAETDNKELVKAHDAYAPIETSSRSPLRHSTHSRSLGSHSLQTVFAIAAGSAAVTGC